MYDYDSKEDVSTSPPPPSPPPTSSKSITTTIEIIYSPTPNYSEINMNQMNNKLRLTTRASTTVREDMKNNDTSYHDCESPAAALSSSSSSSLISSQAEDSIETPIISNRPMHREAPPLLSLPPTLMSPSHLTYEYSTTTSNVTSNIHRAATNKAMHTQITTTATTTKTTTTTSKNKSPRFSSIHDAPIVMSNTTLERWKDLPNQSSTSATTYHTTLLSERLPAIVDLVTFSNHSPDTYVSPSSFISSTWTTDVVRYSIESMIRMGLFFTVHRIKRTLFESHTRELQQRQNFNSSNQYNNAVVISSSNECRQQRNISGPTTTTTTTAPPTLDLNGGKKNFNETDNSMMLPRTPDAKTLTHATPLTFPVPISSASVRGRHHQMKRAVVGIRNYGQTCFLNSVVQALAGLDPFIVYLERIVQLNVRHRQYVQMSTATTSHLSILENDEENTTRNVDSFLARTFPFGSKSATIRQHGNSDLPQPSFFAEDLLNLLRSVNGEQQPATNRQWIDPRPILLAVGQKHKQFQRRYGGVGIVAVGEQQDAQELLQAVLGMIIDEGQFDLTPPAVPSTVMSSFEENNNHDHNESVGDDATRIGDESSFLYKTTAMHSMSKAIEIMMTTTSSTSPCPLSVWCGSSLMCSTCRRVRPIQNVPFLDIPIIPTSISHQMMFQPRKAQDAPSCRLEDCLSEFTAIERVFDVECKNCTIQSEIKERESDRDFQIQIIDGIRSRQCKTSVKSSQNGDFGTANETRHVLNDLHAIEAQLEYLRRLSPDDDSQLYKGINSTTTVVSLEETSTTPIKIPFKRSDAFKCLLLTRLPSILSIHVQRRYYDPNTGKASKTMQHISFPEMLDVSSFCAYGAPKRHHSSFAGTTNRKNTLCGTAVTSMPIWYKLMAVIEHRGGPYSGHYVCYRRDPAATREDRWLWISDDVVRVCQWSNVRSCQAYMLFYEAT